MTNILSRNCIVCNLEFTSWIPTAKYCSGKCRRKYNKAKERAKPDYNEKRRTADRARRERINGGPRKCSTCGTEIGGNRTYCKSCSTKRFANTVKNSIYKKNYGISLEEYNALLESQNGVCAVCEGKTGRKLSVDHDHKTGKVRGLLCVKCNLALGYANDNKNILLGLVEYLDKF